MSGGNYLRMYLSQSESRISPCVDSGEWGSLEAGNACNEHARKPLASSNLREYQAFVWTESKPLRRVLGKIQVPLGRFVRSYLLIAIR